MAVNKGRGTTEISRRVPEVPDNAPTEIKTFLEELIRYLQSYAWEQDFGAPDSIGTSKLMDESVTEVKLEDDSVSTAKLKDDSVSLAKLSSGTAGKFIGYDVSGNPEEKDAPVSNDENVKITASDTTSGFLDGKLSGVGITKTIINPGADETLQLSVDFASTAQNQAGTATGVSVDPAGVKTAIDAQVVDVIASQSFGAVGTYAFVRHNTVATVAQAGDTVSGSDLAAAGVAVRGAFGTVGPDSARTDGNNTTGIWKTAGTGFSLPGTWRVMGLFDAFATNGYSITLCLRIV